jgi:hypothetical protein
LQNGHATVRGITKAPHHGIHLFLHDHKPIRALLNVPHGRQRTGVSVRHERKDAHGKWHHATLYFVFMPFRKHERSPVGPSVEFALGRQHWDCAFVVVVVFVSVSSSVVSSYVARKLIQRDNGSHLPGVPVTEIHILTPLVPHSFVVLVGGQLQKDAPKAFCNLGIDSLLPLCRWSMMMTTQSSTVSFETSRGRTDQTNSEEWIESVADFYHKHQLSFFLRRPLSHPPPIPS